jgi:hypothetical protein
MSGYPIDTTIDQGAAWSGESLLVWGGQRPTNDTGRNTDDAGPISDRGALWTP